MPIFDFDGANTFEADTISFTSVTTITINAADVSEGVTFTVSYRLEFPNTADGSITGAALNTLPTDTGISFSYSASTFLFLSTTQASKATIEFSFVPTANRTAFTAAPVLSGTFGTLPGTVSGLGNVVTFTLSNPANVLSIQSLDANFVCFCEGTRIATPSGRKRVEDLRSEDTVLLADGRHSTVQWLGRQIVDSARALPRSANPIRVTKGALGDGLPVRDLRVSPDHAIAIDGYLINAGALVNGTTIYQERAVTEDFIYYHIETDAHELILAEGVAVETFAGFSTRDMFANAEEATARVIPEMPLPRVSSARLVPESIKQQLQSLIAA